MRPDVENPADVCVGNTAGGLHLGDKARVIDSGVGQLDCYRLAEVVVQGFVDLPHAALSEDPADLKSAGQPLSGLKTVIAECKPPERRNGMTEKALRSLVKIDQPEELLQILGIGVR